MIAIALQATGCGTEGTTVAEPSLAITSTGPKLVTFLWGEDLSGPIHDIICKENGSTTEETLVEGVAGTSHTMEVSVHQMAWGKGELTLVARNEANTLRKEHPAVALAQNLSVNAIGYFKAQLNEAGDRFSAVALSGDGKTLAIGAWGESSNATGINGDQSDNSASESGAVFIFEKSGTAWTQTTYIKASNTGAGDHFGGQVALSDDGKTLAVSAKDEASNATGVNGDQGNNAAAASGAVYIFTKSGVDWTQQAYLKASNTTTNYSFGRLMALSGDGNILAVSSPLERGAATWINGDQSVQTENFSGAVYVFHRTGTNWAQYAYVKATNAEANDLFGASVALDYDGDTMVVSASNEDSNATGFDTDQNNNTAPVSGAVYIFNRVGNSWSQAHYVKASNAETNDLFGSSIDMSNDGNTLVVGAAGEDSSATGVDGDQNDNGTADSGALYVFERREGAWAQAHYIKASTPGVFDSLGYTVAISGDGNVIAASSVFENSSATGVNGDESDDSAAFAGAAFVFMRDGSTWRQRSYVKASNTDANDLFGVYIAIDSDGSTLALGTPDEASNAQGINGDQADNSAAGAGAVYLY